MTKQIALLMLTLASARMIWAQQDSVSPPVGSKPGIATAAGPRNYILAPEDMITVHVQDVEYMGDTPVRIEPSGEVKLPLLGRVLASGLTPAQLEDRIAAALQRYVRNPQVTVRVTEFQGQPVTLLGAVNNPGVHQMRGQKRLLDMIAVAGGLRADAGAVVTLTRSVAHGPIPLAKARRDESGQFSICSIDLRETLNASEPADNVLVEPQDVISVEKAPIVYVVGAVKKSGGFVLNAQQQKVSVLQALAMAEGLDRFSAPDRAKVIRRLEKSGTKQELAVDLKGVLGGKGEDMMMQPGDILFVPTSGAKNASLRAVEAAIQIGTGLAIWGPK